MSVVVAILTLLVVLIAIAVCIKIMAPGVFVQLYVDARKLYFRNGAGATARYIESSGFDSVSVSDSLDTIDSGKDSSEYAIVRMRGLMPAALSVARGAGEQSVRSFLSGILPYVRVRGKIPRIDDCVVVDILASRGQYFPHIHTDIEWALFNRSPGFQVWYLLHNELEEGNMFLIDERAAPASYVKFGAGNAVEVREQCGDAPVSGGDIKGPIKYARMAPGDCLLFGQRVYHASDYRPSPGRWALNMRIIIKDEDGGVPVNTAARCTYAKYKMLGRAVGKDGKIRPRLMELAAM